MGQLLQFQNLHRTKKSEGSTPELWEGAEEEEEGPGEEAPEDLETIPPLLELQPVPLPKRESNFTFEDDWRVGWGSRDLWGCVTSSEVGPVWRHQSVVTSSPRTSPPTKD